MFFAIIALNMMWDLQLQHLRVHYAGSGQPKQHWTVHLKESLKPDLKTQGKHLRPQSTSCGTANPSACLGEP